MIVWPPERRQGRKTEKPCVCCQGAFGEFSEMWQGLEKGSLRWTVYENIPDSLGMWTPGAGMELAPEQ